MNCAAMFETAKQCSTCRDWVRRHTMDDTGQCCSDAQKPDASYGRIRLDSDGCKYWKPDVSRRRDD